MQATFATFMDSLASGNGPTFGPNSYSGIQTFQVVHVANASLTSVTAIQGSNLDSSSLLGTAGYWTTLGTVTLTGSSVVSDTLVTEAPYRWYRGKIISASGTSTAISIYMGLTRT